MVFRTTLGRARRRSVPIVVILATFFAMLTWSNIATAVQSPAGCNENDFILQVAHNPAPPFTVGQTINYVVRTGNTDPSAPGCDMTDVTTKLTLPNGVVVTLETGGNYPFPTPVAPLGAPIPYTVNLADAIAGPCGNVATCPIIVASVRADGLLHDNPQGDPDPATIIKQLSGPVQGAGGRHYFCYEVRRDNPAAGPMTALDQFGISTMQLLQPHQLCTPADKNDEDPTAPQDPQHLVGYEPKTTTLAGQGKKVLVTNQFGTIALQLSSVGLPKYPASKSLTPPPGAPIANPTVDHFMCYGVRGAPGSGPQFAGVNDVKVDDQFGTVVVDLTKPHELCAPAELDGKDPGAATHTTHLMCYSARLNRGTSANFPQFVYTNDDRGPRTLKMDRVWTFCVPSTKQVLP
jgi:hypothetical protein